MIESVWREIVIFSIALTLPTYFIRVIDKIPSVFKRYVFKVKWWWKQRHCTECGEPFKWNYNKEGTACRSVCNECVGNPVKRD